MMTADTHIGDWSTGQSVQVTESMEERVPVDILGKLYVCYTTTAFAGHPCGVASEAVRAAGHDPDIAYAFGCDHL